MSVVLTRSASPAFRGDRLIARFAAVCTAGFLAACGGEPDAAAQAREAQARETTALADEAARLAAGNSGRGAAQRDSGPHLKLGSHSGAGLARGDDPPLGPGDVRVMSTDSMLVLAVIGDTVRTRLGTAAVEKMRHKMADDADSASGFGGLVARAVKGALAGGLSEAARFSLRVPAREVRDLRYEDGQLRFHTGKDGETGARFAAADAERFIAAVRARQARPTGR